jgi:ribosomal protein L11 methyltransferase
MGHKESKDIYMTEETGDFYILTVQFDNTDIAAQINDIALESFHVDGIEEFSIDEAEVDEILGERAYSGGDVPEEVIDEVEVETKANNQISYKYYFFNGDIQRAEQFSNFLKENHKDVKVQLEHEQFSDWNEEWKKHYAPINVTENLNVVPEWYKEDNHKDNDKNIYINPGMGFGTGEHETTYLCLKLYDSVVDKVKDKGLCLDFGCGSGILGIGAIKKNKMQVDFIDIDPAALDNCLQNLELNFHQEDLNGHALIHRSKFDLKEKYQVVFANILEHVLLSEKELLLACLDKDSYLILSGILNEQVDNIKENYSSLEHIETVSKGDWSAILFKS